MFLDKIDKKIEKEEMKLDKSIAYWKNYLFEKIENNYCVFFQGVVIYYHTILLARVG